MLCEGMMQLLGINKRKGGKEQRMKHLVERGVKTGPAQKEKKVEF